MFLNTEIQAALDAAKAKINDHTRQAAGDMSSACTHMSAAMQLLNDRRIDISRRRAELEAEERQAEWDFQKAFKEGLAEIETIKQGMRDSEPTGGEPQPEQLEKPNEGGEPEGNVATLPPGRRAHRG